MRHCRWPAPAESLSVDPSWEDIFDDAQDARKFAEELERQIEQLRASVGLAIQAAIDRSPTGEERMWAEISRADLMFLNDKQPPARVKNSYTAAVPEDNLFAWAAVAKQLSLFANLNIRSDLAKQIIETLDARFKQPAPEPDLHVVIFAGHRIDEVGRAVRRFPADREQQAGELIRNHCF